MGVSLRIRTMPAEISKKYWYISEFRGGRFITYPINKTGRAFAILTILLVVGWQIL